MSALLIGKVSIRPETSTRSTNLKGSKAVLKH